MVFKGEADLYRAMSSESVETRSIGSLLCRPCQQVIIEKISIDIEEVYTKVVPVSKFKEALGVSETGQGFKNNKEGTSIRGVALLSVMNTPECQRPGEDLSVLICLSIQFTPSK